MNNRIAFVDMLKTLAIIGVIIIHISADWLLNLKVGSLGWDLALIWGTVIRWSVPVFLMCSGVLFLNKDKKVSIKSLYTKYMFRIVIALLFWAVMYEAVDVLRVSYTSGNVKDAVIQSVKNILTFNTQDHLYFLYLIILIYALLPIIRVFTDNAEKHQMEYALLAWVVLGIIYPLLTRFYPFTLLKGIVVQYKIVFAYSSIGYFVLGQYLYRHTLGKKVTYIIYSLGITGLAATVCGSIYLSVSSHKVNALLLDGMTPNIAVMAAALFLFIKNNYTIAANGEKRVDRIVYYISKGSFCIYLVHFIFIIAFRTIGILRPSNSVLYLIPSLVLLDLILSLGVYFLLSKIPLANKYLV